MTYMFCIFISYLEGLYKSVFGTLFTHWHTLMAIRFPIVWLCQHMKVKIINLLDKRLVTMLLPGCYELPGSTVYVCKISAPVSPVWVDISFLSFLPEDGDVASLHNVVHITSTLQKGQYSENILTSIYNTSAIKLSNRVSGSFSVICPLVSETL